MHIIREIPLRKDALICSLCEREAPDKKYMEDHHLTPRCKKGKDTIQVCIDCGNQIHELFSIKELRDTYNTLEALKSSPKIWKWIKWVQKRDFGVCMKSKKRRK